MPRLQCLRLRHDNLDITTEGSTLMKYLGHPSPPLEQWHSDVPLPSQLLCIGNATWLLFFRWWYPKPAASRLPSDNLPTESELRLVLSNLVDILEILSLICTVRDVEPSSVSEEHLTFPHVLSLGYGRTIKEVELILQFLDIPVVRDLSIRDCHIVPLPASDGAFTHIMKRLPLNQMISLKPSNVHFEVREDYIMSQDVLDGKFDSEEELSISLRFIHKLTTIKQLSVSSPCPIFTYFATYPADTSRRR